jgi:hypothetical protein
MAEVTDRLFDRLFDAYRDMAHRAMRNTHDARVAADELRIELEKVIAERDEARFQARCFANRMREYSHLTDLRKELRAGEDACPWLHEEG